MTERPAFSLSTKVDHKRYYNQQTYPSPFYPSSPVAKQSSNTSVGSASEFAPPKKPITTNQQVSSSSSAISSSTSASNSMYSPPQGRSSSTTRATLQSPPNYPPSKKQRATSTPRPTLNTGSRRATGIPSVSASSSGSPPKMPMNTGSTSTGLSIGLNRPFHPSNNIRVATNVNAGTGGSTSTFASRSQGNSTIPLPGAITSSKSSDSNTISPNMANDAIAKRRAELRRLQMEQSSQNEAGQALIDRARRLTGGGSSTRPSSSIGGISSNASSTFTTSSRKTKITPPKKLGTSPSGPPPSMPSSSLSTSSSVSMDSAVYATRSRPIAVPSSPKPKVTSDGTASHSFGIQSSMTSGKIHGIPSLQSPTKDLTSQPDPISTPPSMSPSEQKQTKAAVAPPLVSTPSQPKLRPTINTFKPEPISTREPSITTTLSTSSPPHGHVVTQNDGLATSPKKGPAPPLPSFITTTTSTTTAHPTPPTNKTSTRDEKPQSRSPTAAASSPDKTPIKSLSSKRKTLMELRSAAETPPPKDANTLSISPTASNSNTPFTSTMPSASIKETGSNVTAVVIKDEDAAKDGDASNNLPTTIAESKPKSSELRLLKQLVEANEQKKELAEKMSKLEREVTEYRKQKVSPSQDFSTPIKRNHSTVAKEDSIDQLLEICRTKGKDFAMEWAKQNMDVQSSSSQQPLPRLVQDDDVPSSIQKLSDRKKRNGIKFAAGSMRNENGGGMNSAMSFDGSHRGRTTVPKPPSFRIKSPMPTQRRFQQAQSPLADNQIASRAVETVEDMYCSDMARFYVRKPYGGNETMLCSLKEPDSSNQSHSMRDGVSSDAKLNKSPVKVEWVEPVESYLRNATVHDEKTLEVMAKIGADDSILILYGSCNIKHGTVKLGNDGTIVGHEWMTIENVDDTNEPLGRVMYIDVDGNDGEYWLDTIYEEALKIRESYSSNVFSAAMAIKATASDQTKEQKDLFHVQSRQEPGLQAQSPIMTRTEIPSPIKLSTTSSRKTVDACIGTDDLVTTKPSGRIGVSAEPKKNKPEVEPIKHTPEKSTIPPPDEPYGDSGSTDALSRFIIFFFSSIFNFIWFILISLPVKMVWWTFLSMALCTATALIWLFLSDDNGAKGLGAGIDFAFNSASLYRD